MLKSIGGPQTPSQQLRHFTDREKERDVVKRLITKRDAPLPVVMFYGVGGTGKSWLLRKLKEELAEEHPSLPTAVLDLEPQSGGTAYHADSSKALAYIRRQYKDVICPRFDLAHAWLRYGAGDAEEPLLKGVGPAAEAFELVKEVAGAVAGIPLVGYGMKKIGAVVSEKFKNTRLERWYAEATNQEDFLRLRSAEPPQLYRELGDRLLRDLAKNLPPRGDSHCRAVIFLDTFEAVGLGLQGPAQRHEREAWVRDLHATDSPVLLVLAGRDRLAWDECEGEYADPALLDQHLVGGLSEPDARAFLGKCGFAGPLLQDAILRVSVDTESASAGRERGHHPFSLGLCADAVVNLSAAGPVDPATFDMPPGDVKTMTQLFLKSLRDEAQETWVRHLGLTPRFDKRAGREAFSPVPGAAQDAAWHALLGYSFVQNTDEPGWWTLHARMRDALAHGPNAADDHRFWMGHWQARSESETDAAASLAWYHKWCLDPMTAWRAWHALAKQMRHETRMADHLRVLEWWEPTGLLRRTPASPDEARMLNWIGIEYFYASCGNAAENTRKAVGCHEAALRLFREAEFPEEWGFTQNYLGLAYWKLDRSEGKCANLRKAFECYEKALRIRTEQKHPQQWARTQNELGSAYWDAQGDRVENLQRAVMCFAKALRVFTEGGFPEAWASTQNNLGTTYRKLAEVQPGPYLRKAIRCYEDALRVYGPRVATKTEIPREWATTQDNLGTVYRMLRDENWVSNLQKAVACYEAALRVRTQENFPQYWGETNWNLGLAHADLAERTGDRSHLSAALSAFEKAARGYSDVGMIGVAEAVHADVERVWAKLAESARDSAPAANPGGGR